MRLVTCGFEVGVPIDGSTPGLHPTAFTPLDSTNPRSGGYALAVSSETGVPDGTSTSLINSATMARQWTFGNRPFLMTQAWPGTTTGETYFNRAGFSIRAYVRWNTGNLPSASKAVEFLLSSDMSDLNQYGRTALCIDYLGRLHWKADARTTMPPTEDVTPDGHDHVASTIVPFGFLISDPLALDTWHMVEVGITPSQESVRLNGTLIFTRCRLGNNILRPDPRFGWGVVYSGGGVVNNTGSMGSNRKVYFDDVAINDLNDDGNGQDGFPGAGRVLCVRPVADVSADYSWDTGGPQSIWRGLKGVSLPDFVVSQDAHGLQNATTPPPFWAALDNIPMNTPSSTDYGASNKWIEAFNGTQRGYGTSLTQTNPYEIGYDCYYPQISAVPHQPGPDPIIPKPPQRNYNSTGVDPSSYMVTSGASDWRLAPGVGRMPFFSPGVFHADWQFIFPRAGGQDALTVNCADPATSGTVLLAYAWCYNGAAVGGNRSASAPVPSGEAAMNPGLKVWMPSDQGEPSDRTLDVGGGALLGADDYAPGLAGTPPLTMKRTRSIAPPGGAAYTGAACYTVYGAGIYWEDQSSGAADLPETCNALMILV